ncbi:MAG: filamentous hemagglutinin family protein, partial [Nevskiales bacterium]|nr:filamentous hemagglutinin family protein [Nevskiales bacterium]
RANPDVAPGDVDLIAPKGEVNAGEAGIRALGNLNIAALSVVGADNIQVGGLATGLPVADSNVAGTVAAAGAASGASKVTDDLASPAGLTDDNLSDIDVEVLGFGDNERQL